MHGASPFHCFQRRRPAASALVITLAIVALISILLVGFLSGLRTETAAARTHVNGVRAQFYARMGADVAQARLAAAMPPVGTVNTNRLVTGTTLTSTATPNVALPWVSLPGRVLTTPPAADAATLGAAALGTTVDLSSGAAASAADDAVDLNPATLADPAQRMLTQANTTILPVNNPAMRVRWRYVCQDGSFLDTLPATPAAAASPVVGRFAFWVDDESAKINVNTAWTRAPASNNPASASHPSRVSLGALPPLLLLPGEPDAIRNWRGNQHLFNSLPELQAVDAVTAALPGQYPLELTHYNHSLDLNMLGERRIVLTTQKSLAGGAEVFGHPQQGQHRPGQLQQLGHGQGGHARPPPRRPAHARGLAGAARGGFRAAGGLADEVSRRWLALPDGAQHHGLRAQLRIVQPGRGTAAVGLFPQGSARQGGDERRVGEHARQRAPSARHQGRRLVRCGGGSGLHLQGGGRPAAHTGLPVYLVDGPTVPLAAITSLAVVTDPRLNKNASNFKQGPYTFNTTAPDVTASLTPQSGLAAPQDTDASGKIVTDSVRLPAPKGSATNPTGIVSSVGELGYIHSGMQCRQGFGPGTPWRTLHFQPQTAANAGQLPDWAVMDLFAAPVVPTPSSASEATLLRPTVRSTGGKVNLNAAIYPFTDASGQPLRTRLETLRALLYGAKRTDGGVPLAADDATALAANIARYTLAKGGPNNLQGRAYGPGDAAGVFYAPGQLAEIAGVADAGESSEGLLREIAGLCTGRGGDVFSIYSVGQAIQQDNKGNVLVLGEHRGQRVVERWETVKPGTPSTAPGAVANDPGLATITTGFRAVYSREITP